MSDSPKAVFLSYASQDAAAALRIAESLRAVGVEVWFDQNELVGGDAWDAKIRKQISECGLFVPVISSNTQARDEGYFRLEWKLAVDRSHLMAHDKPFLLPVVIDVTTDAAARVPPEFRAVQWTRLPGGDATEKFCARVKALLGGEAAVAGSDVAARLVRAQEDGRGPSAPLKKPTRPWLVPAIIFGAAAVIALTLWQPWRGNEKAPPPAQLPHSTAAAPLSEARKLVAQARALFDDGDEANHENFFLSDDLLKKAQAIDSTDGEIWAAQAELSADMVIPSYDRSTARLQLLRTQAERAVKLAPDSTEAQLAYASYLTAASFLTADGERLASEALTLIRKLTLTPAQQSRAWRLEMYCMVTLGKLGEWMAMMERDDAPQGRDPRLLDRATGQCIFAGRYAEAEKFNNRSLAIRRTGRSQMMDVTLKLAWRGDLDGAAAALAEWPSWLTLEDRGAFQASQVWLWRHEPDKAIAVLAPVTRDFLNDSWYAGPKAVLVALAQEMAGNAQAARAAWEETKRVATRVASEQLADQRVLAYKAIAMLRLGETAEAETLFRQLEQTKSLRSEFWSNAAPSALLRIAVGRGNEVVAKFDQELRSNSARSPAPSPRAALQLNPVFDAIRATPEFQKWMAAAPAPEEKKENKTTSVAVHVVNEKSLVVLPLENLSPDPENAFFTDGMHAEIISTLGQISDLKVISRNSALAFKGSTAPLAEIAQKLGVANVLTGSVRRAGNTVRIQLELRRASDEALLWSLPKGDRDLKDVLGLQSEVADQVARVLQARETRGSYASAQFTTKDPLAYDLFLKAKALFDQRPVEKQLEAIRLTEEALRIDPNYATAANLLAHAHQRVYSIFANQDPEARVQHARESKHWGEVAQKLMPGGAGDGGLSMYYSIAEHDTTRGLALAENVRRALPNDAEAYNFLGVALAESGRVQESAECFVRAAEINPQVANYPRNLLIRYSNLRRASDSRAAAEQYERLGAKNEVAGRQSLALAAFTVSGELPSDFSGFIGADKAIWLRRARQFEPLVKETDAMLASGSAETPERIIFLQLKCDALQQLGRKAEAETAAREAVTIATKLQSAPEIGPTEKPGWLAQAYSRAGRIDEAVAAMRRYVDAASPSTQVRVRWQREITAAELYAYANRPRECVELLTKLLHVPSGLTVPMLKVDPAWDNIREDAGFKALLADPQNSAPL